MQRAAVLVCVAATLALVHPAVAAPPAAAPPAAAPLARPNKSTAYVGVHPIPAGHGGGFCLIEGPHVHIYLPEHADELYRVIGGRYLFIGDPVPFGYDGPRHAYHGPHPVPVDEIVEGDHREHDGSVFCYLEGPHFHIYLAPPALHFVERGGAAWYVGEWPRSYQLDGPRYRKINAIYQPMHYERPIVIATAPVGYHIPEIAITVQPAARVVHRPRPGVVVVRLPWIVVDDDADDVHYHRHGKHHHHHHHHHDHHEHHDDD